jgi:hypothetical protein
MTGTEMPSAGCYPADSRVGPLRSPNARYSSGFSPTLSWRLKGFTPCDTNTCTGGLIAMEQRVSAIGLAGLASTPRGRGLILLLIVVFTLSVSSYFWALDSGQFEESAFIFPLTALPPSLLLIGYTFVAGHWRIRYYWFLVSALGSVGASILFMAEIIVGYFGGGWELPLLFLNIGWLSAVSFILIRGRIERPLNRPSEDTARAEVLEPISSAFTPAASPSRWVYISVYFLFALIFGVPVIISEILIQHTDWYHDFQKQGTILYTYVHALLRSTYAGIVFVIIYSGFRSLNIRKVLNWVFGLSVLGLISNYGSSISIEDREISSALNNSALLAVAVFFLIVLGYFSLNGRIYQSGKP